MCSVIGFVTRDGNEAAFMLLKELILESKIRGLHAFGVSYLADGSIMTMKSREIKPVIEEIRNIKPKALIYHNRYSTSGDFRDPDNNQPTHYGEISVAVNGVISMKPREEYEKDFGVSCKCDNDAEVLLRILEQDLDLVQFLKDYPEITCAMTYIHKGRILALRNNKRPLHYFQIFNSIYVVSTKDIAIRAFTRLGLRVNIHDVPAFEVIDLHERLPNH